MAQPSAKVKCIIGAVAPCCDGLSQHCVQLRPAEFLKLPLHCLRDTFFATGRAQAADNAGLRFGTGLILGFAVGGL
jgi:hypothetical protein